MRTKIYTKGGDRGETGILGRERLSKADPRLCAYGAIDELNAAMGVAISTLPDSLRRLSDFLTHSQHLLFVIGSHLACADETMRARLPAFDSAETKKIEGEIDGLTAVLPELREFILPGGAPAAAHVHLCRTVCRRAEREIVNFFDGNRAARADTHGDDLIAYLNRLGDYLFVAARFANHTLHVNETTWQK